MSEQSRPIAAPIAYVRSTARRLRITITTRRCGDAAVACGMDRPGVLSRLNRRIENTCTGLPDNGSRRAKCRGRHVRGGFNYGPSIVQPSSCLPSSTSCPTTGRCSLSKNTLGKLPSLNNINLNIHMVFLHIICRITSSCMGYIRHKSHSRAFWAELIVCAAVMPKRWP